MEDRENNSSLSADEASLAKMEFPRWAIANSHYLEFHNRLAPDLDFTCISLILGSIFIYLMFILIVLTARRRKVPTFFIGSAVISTGSLLLFAYQDPYWYTGSALINSSYNLHQPNNFAMGEIKIKIGLRTFNVSYVSVDNLNSNLSFSYNELFKFDSSHPKHNLESIFQEGLSKGLPNPIIMVLDYLSFSRNRQGLCWSKAGSASADALIFVCFFFVVGIILLVLTPRYGLYFIALDGTSLLGTVLLYFIKAPMDPSIIIEGTSMSFGYGRVFYATIAIGSLNLILIAAIVTCIYTKKMKHVSTFFELNFDTPWDDQVIVRQSAEAKENVDVDGQYTRRISVRKIRRSVRRLQDSFNHKISVRFRNHLNESQVESRIEIEETEL